jgi:hypothetical protein
MAGFEVAMHGRFWVATEDRLRFRPLQADPQTICLVYPETDLILRLPSRSRRDGFGISNIDADLYNLCLDLRMVKQWSL